MNRIARAVLSGLFLTLPFTGVQAFDLTHGEGTLHLDTAPARVVSYDLGVLDTLTELGVEAVGAPKSVYQGNLVRYQDSPVVGTLFEPDYAVLKDLQPDLIVAGGRSRRAMPQLAEVAPTIIFDTDEGAFLESFRRDTRALAQAFDQSAPAARALDALDDGVRALHEANQGKTAVFLFVIRDQVIAHAPGERFGYAYELTGLTSVLPEKEQTSAPAAPRPAPGSPEAKAAQRERAKVVSAAAAADPDWLIVLDRGAINGAEKTAADTLAAHPELSKTRAYQNGQVYYADPNGWYVVTGGLDNLKRITEDLLARMGS